MLLLWPDPSKAPLSKTEQITSIVCARSSEMPPVAAQKHDGEQK